MAGHEVFSPEDAKENDDLLQSSQKELRRLQDVVMTPEAIARFEQYIKISPSVDAIKQHVDETITDADENEFALLEDEAGKELQNKTGIAGLIAMAKSVFKVAKSVLSYFGIKPYQESEQFQMRNVQSLKPINFADENLTELLTLKDELLVLQQQSTGYKKMAYTKYISDIDLRIYDMQQIGDAVVDETDQKEKTSNEKETINRDKEYERIKSQLQPGDIVLLNYDAKGPMSAINGMLQNTQGSGFVHVGMIGEGENGDNSRYHSSLNTQSGRPGVEIRESFGAYVKSISRGYSVTMMVVRARDGLRKNQMLAEAKKYKDREYDKKALLKDVNMSPIEDESAYNCGEYMAAILNGVYGNDFIKKHRDALPDTYQKLGEKGNDFYQAGLYNYSSMS